MESKGNSSEFPNSSFRLYLAELAAEIVANGNPHGDLIAEARAAHERRQRFAAEMRDGKTERAQMARRVLIANVQANIVSRSLAERALSSCAGLRLSNDMAGIRADVLGGWA